MVYRVSSRSHIKIKQFRCDGRSVYMRFIAKKKYLAITKKLITGISLHKHEYQNKVILSFVNCNIIHSFYLYDKGAICNKRNVCQSEQDAVQGCLQQGVSIQNVYDCPCQFVRRCMILVLPFLRAKTRRKFCPIIWCQNNQKLLKSF